MAAATGSSLRDSLVTGQEDGLGMLEVGSWGSEEVGPVVEVTDLGQGRTVYIKEAGGSVTAVFEHPSVFSSLSLIYISTAISYIVELSSPLSELPTNSTYSRRSTSLIVGTIVPYPIDRTRQVSLIPYSCSIASLSGRHLEPSPPNFLTVGLCRSRGPLARLCLLVPSCID